MRVIGAGEKIAVCPECKNIAYVSKEVKDESKYRGIKECWMDDSRNC